jgi:hypothetical protein
MPLSKQWYHKPTPEEKELRQRIDALERALEASRVEVSALRHSRDVALKLLAHRERERIER